MQVFNELFKTVDLSNTFLVSNGTLLFQWKSKHIREAVISV